MSAQQGEFTILLCARQPTTLARKWVNAKLLMKQLDVVVSPPAFLWDPYLTLTNVIFDLDNCGL